MTPTQEQELAMEQVTRIMLVACETVHHLLTQLDMPVVRQVMAVQILVEGKPINGAVSWPQEDLSGAAELARSAADVFDHQREAR